MSKILVDRELLELLRNFTFLHDDGCAGALRGNIDKALAAQPAEAEGVEARLRTVIDELKAGFVVCQQCGDQEDTATLDCMQELEAIAAALSAVTAARDDLHAELLREIEKTCQLGMDCNGLKAELRDMTAERDRLRGEVFGLRISLKDSDAGLVHFVNRRDQLGMEVDKLRAEVEMLREDAERWRYVSLQGDDTHWLNLLRVDLEDFGGNINAAVDALIDGEAPAMAAKEAEPEHVCSGCGAKGWTGNCLECIPY